jgi:polycomb-like protein 2
LKHSSPTNPCESTTTTNSQTNGNIPTTSTPAETSGDDTSSRGTLDIFIPPPKDFEGQNNPFRSIQTSTPNSITPPPVAPTSIIQVPPTTIITNNTTTSTKTYIKTTKRQLNEQDIRIGKNGEVKRRRFRRRNGLTTTNIPANKLYKTYKKDCDVQDNVITLRTVYHRSSKQNNGPTVPRSGSTCVEHALNNGRLRSHDSKDKEETVSSLTPNSPVKNTSNDVSMEDIKSSLNHYFGAANRIASGENFKVLAKRTLSCGKQQFLLEWDSPAS